MKRILFFLFAAALSLVAAAKPANRQVVVFDVDLHCQGCINKIEKNIAFEKGVKDLACDLDSKTVTVTFDPSKTNIEQLQKAFAQIKKPAKVNENATETAQQAKK